MTINRKKVNTLELIQQMAQKNKETVNAVEEIKKGRSSNISEAATKQHFRSKSVRKMARTWNTKDVEHFEPSGAMQKNRGDLKELDLLLDTDIFRDKKGTFVMPLSAECLSKYELLATGISYKLGLKTKRNTLMRKILEDFINKKFTRLIKEIDQK